jgi:hypothetical protein
MKPSRRISWLAVTIAGFVAAGTTALGPAPATAAPPGGPVRTCAGLAKLKFTDGTKITGAEDTTAPGICHVMLVVPESINIDVSLPVSGWNGRFQGVGGGGFAGSVSPPDSAAKMGYAAAATDTGHSAPGSDGSWAWSPTGMKRNLIEDFAYRSLHELTVKGKTVTQAYYGRAAGYSYWNGCSTGGRQGLMEAQRYPNDYDGVLSGAPAINWDRFIPSELWPQVVMHEAGDVLPSCKMTAFNQAVTTACDSRDGVTDQVVDPRVCGFDPDKLIGKKTDCGTITAQDAAVIKKIWQGPRSKDGSFLWYGLTPGSSLSDLAASSAGVPQPFPISADWFKWWLAKNPNFDWTTVTTANFAKYFAQSQAEYHEVIGTDSPDLSRFRDSGGKLIVWHGLADQLIFPQGTINYYDRVAQKMGGLNRTEQFARLFLAPGVGHCGGGTGAAPTDPLSALVTWVEHRHAPESLAGGNATFTRPLCLFPEVARYQGHGNTNDAASFRCGKTYTS